MKKELTTNVDRYQLGYLKALTDVEKTIERMDKTGDVYLHIIDLIEELGKLKEKNE